MIHLLSALNCSIFKTDWSRENKISESVYNIPNSCLKTATIKNVWCPITRKQLINCQYITNYIFGFLNVTKGSKITKVKIDVLYLCRIVYKIILVSP